MRRVKYAPGTYAGKILKPFRNQKGYLQVALGGSTGRKFTVHHLVAAAFIGPRPNGLTINHQDTNKTNNTPDNTPDNLEYVTNLEKMRHAIRHGFYSKK